jgi:hypothetical protein
VIKIFLTIPLASISTSSAALKQAVKDGIIRANPAEHVNSLPQGDSE